MACDLTLAFYVSTLTSLFHYPPSVVPLDPYLRRQPPPSLCTIPGILARQLIFSYWTARERGRKCWHRERESFCFSFFSLWVKYHVARAFEAFPGIRVEFAKHNDILKLSLPFR